MKLTKEQEDKIRNYDEYPQNNEFIDSDKLYEAYARYILEESDSPVDDIIELIQAMKQKQKEELEETMRIYLVI